MRTLSLWNDIGPSTPFRSLMDLQRNLDKLFDQTVGETSTDGLQSRNLQPACDVEETDSHYVLSVDLPGVAKKDIQIDVKDNQLIISAERRNEKRTRGFSERAFGRFQRMVILPTNVDAEKIEAHYEDGVLTIGLPKAESAKARQIKIGEGKTSFFSKLAGNSKDSEKAA